MPHYCATFVAQIQKKKKHGKTAGTRKGKTIHESQKKKRQLHSPPLELCTAKVYRKKNTRVVHLTDYHAGIACQQINTVGWWIFLHCEYYSAYIRYYKNLNGSPRIGGRVVTRGKTTAPFFAPDELISAPLTPPPPPQKQVAGTLRRIKPNERITRTRVRRQQVYTGYCAHSHRSRYSTSQGPAEVTLLIVRKLPQRTKISLPAPPPTDKKQQPSFPNSLLHIPQRFITRLTNSIFLA